MGGEGCKVILQSGSLRVSSTDAMVYSGLGQDGCKGCLRNYCLVLLICNVLEVAQGMLVGWEFFNK
jgi:hypothetical protein